MERKENSGQSRISKKSSVESTIKESLRKGLEGLGQFAGCFGSIVLGGERHCNLR